VAERPTDPSLLIVDLDAGPPSGEVGYDEGHQSATPQRPHRTTAPSDAGCHLLSGV
jgi:hypothetical protein